ncbi:MAG: hypothetical protein HIU81_03065 [Acidobacteria bacterium]|nr:hypothetical protein [Acidobacteriota bacterium]
MGVFSEGVEVHCSLGGEPLNLRWSGRDYVLAAESVRWFERRDWWAQENRAEVGRGAGLVDSEIWRVQAQADGVGPLLTFELSKHCGSGRWRILRLYDALSHSA